MMLASSSHIEYHPQNVSHHDIHHIFYDTLARGHCGSNQFVIAYSRPQNLRDALTQMKLMEHEGFHASDFLQTGYWRNHLVAICYYRQTPVKKLDAPKE
jgi:hypothetical protein